MPGSPGVSTMYLSDAPVAANLTTIRTFWNALVAGLPNTLSLQVFGSGDIIDDTDGRIAGSWTAAAPAVVAGTSASGYGAPVGSCVNWLTNGIVAHRHVRGRTFIVPTVNQFEPGGTLLATWITTLTTAASTMMTGLAPLLTIWARPFEPKPGDDAPARDGSSHQAIGVSVPDKAIVLRSRRD